MIIDYLTIRERYLRKDMIYRSGKEARILRKLNQWFKNDSTLTHQQRIWLAN